MAKRLDPAKAKEKKQKIIAIGGAVLLVAILAYEIPNVMKMLNKKPPPGSYITNNTTPTTTTGTPSLAAPTLGGAEQAVTTTASSGDGVSSGDVAPPAQDGQLASFSRFESKDPLAQQIDTSSAASGGGSVPTPSTPSAGSTASGGGTSSGSGGSTGSTSSPTAPTSSPAPGSAVISVNGTLMSVTVGGDFPATQPFFHLVSLTAHTANVSIVGGSYASGAPTVTLHENKPLTLMNTADGTRYKLVVKPQGTPVPGASTPSATPTTTTTPSP